MGVAKGEAGIQRAPTQANLRNQAFTDKAHGCGSRNVELFRLNSNPELFAKHHSQEAE